MSLIILNISLKTLYVLLYAIFHSLGYILLLYYSIKPINSMKENVSDTNNYLVLINFFQIFYLFLYLIEKIRTKSDKGRQKSEFFTETKTEDKLIITREVVEYSRDDILKKQIQLTYSCRVKTAIIMIFIFCSLVDSLYQKMLYFILNGFSFQICDLFCSFYYSFYSLVIFLSITFSNKVIINKYRLGKHQKFSLIVLFICGIIYLINGYIGNIFDFKVNFFFVVILICIPIIVFFQGWKFTFIKILIDKYYFSIYFILGMKGLLHCSLDIGWFFICKNIDFLKRNDEVFYIFNINKINNLKFGIPSIIILVMEKLFLILTISSFNSLYAASSQKVSESFICIYELFYFLFWNPQYDKKSKCTIIIMFLLFVLFLFINFIFSEIIILNFCGFQNKTYYFLLKNSLKERYSRSESSNNNSDGVITPGVLGYNSSFHDLSDSEEKNDRGSSFENGSGRKREISF